MFIKKMALFILLVSSIAVSVYADDVSKGLDAYKKGDYTKAVKFYKKACDGGNAIGCSYFGLMYEFGKGVKRDNFKAVKFYKKGCDGGNAIGCFNLGAMYEFGKGVRQDSQKALKYYGEACDMENEDGCKNYAKLKKQGY